mgnify:CR=1 FL=1
MGSGVVVVVVVVVVVQTRIRIANTGFSRASRSPALRRLAKLAPPASARMLLRPAKTEFESKPANLRSF